MQKEEIQKLQRSRQHPISKAPRTFGQYTADLLTLLVGSWHFIIGVFIFLIIWIALNIVVIVEHWDPYPFILLNFVLSCLAAMQAPIILMSQNREVQRDRLRAEYDYQINKKAEAEIRELRKDVQYMKRILEKR